MTHPYPWLAALGLAALASTAFLFRRARPQRSSIDHYDWS